MPFVSKILVRIITRDKEGAGTDGDVYLGVCGREFLIDSAHDDFESGSDRTYALTTLPVNPGEVVVKNRGDNSPLSPHQLNSNYIDIFPVYVRFEPRNRGDHWIVQYVHVTAFISSGSDVTYEILGPNKTSMYQKLGTSCGKWLFLRKIISRERKKKKNK